MKLRSCQAELNQKAFESLFIPPRVSLPPFNNKGRVFSNPVTKRFIDSQGGLNINEFDEETMFIEPGQILDPVRKFRILLFQFYRVLVRFSLMKLLVKARFNEEGLTVSSVIIMGDHIGNDFQPYWSHSFPPFLHQKHNKRMIGIQWL